MIESQPWPGEREAADGAGDSLDMGVVALITLLTARPDSGRPLGSHGLDPALTAAISMQRL